MDVDGDVLDGFVQLAVDHPGDHLGLANREFEALATHGLDEDRELQLAAALHLPRVGSFRGENAKRHVANELLVESILDHSGGQKFSLGAGDR